MVEVGNRLELEIADFVGQSAKNDPQEARRRLFVSEHTTSDLNLIPLSLRLDADYTWNGLRGGE